MSDTKAINARYKAAKHREILLDDIAAVFKSNQEAMLRAEDLLEENESLDAFVWVRRLADTLIVLAEGTLGGYYGDKLRKERAGVREAFGYPTRGGSTVWGTNPDDFAQDD